MSSYYEALPIYRAALDTAAAVDPVVRRFPRDHEYTLGARLRTATADLLIGVVRSNRGVGRAEAPASLCDRIEELKLLSHRGVVNEAEEAAGAVKGRRLAYLYQRPPAAVAKPMRIKRSCP